MIRPLIESTRLILGARFNAELENVYERAFTYVVSQVCRSFDGEFDAPPLTSNYNVDKTQCSRAIGTLHKTRSQSEDRSARTSSYAPLGSPSAPSQPLEEKKAGDGRGSFLGLPTSIWPVRRVSAHSRVGDFSAPIPILKKDGQLD